MQTTTNLGLNKPQLTDAPDITQLNGNWDKIDANMAKKDLSNLGTITAANAAALIKKLGIGYGTCATAAATAAKAAVLAGYTLVTGGLAAVKFTYAVGAAATLNINGAGAKAIYNQGAALKAGVIQAGMTALLVYNGTQYDLLAVSPEGPKYAVCATAAATAAKVAAIESGFTLVTGAVALVKFTSGNTAASPTMNINGTGAKALYLNGAYPATSWIRAGMTLELVYNGTQYEIVNGLGVATASALGAVKSGGDVAISSAGEITVKDDSHNHVISNVDGLQTALDGKAAAGHGHNAATANAPGFMAAADKSKLDGLNADYYANAENLFVNGDFQVWEYGFSQTDIAVSDPHTNGWRGSGNCFRTVAKTADGLKLTAASAGQFMGLGQRVAMNNALANAIREDGSNVVITYRARASQACLDYNGKALDTDWMIHTQTINISNERMATAVTNGYLLLDLGAKSLANGADLPVGFWLEYQWALLGIGKIPPRHVPKPYVDELLRAQLYNGADGTIGVGYTSKTVTISNTAPVETLRDGAVHMTY